MHFLRNTSLILLFLIIGKITTAQKLSVNAPSYVEKNSVFSVRYVFKDTKNLGKPSFSIQSNSYFEVLNTMSSYSSSYSISIINGKINKVQEQDYIWTVYMQANKEGTYELPEASVKLPNGTIIQADPYSITVGKPNNQLPKPQNNQNIANNNVPKSSQISELSMLLSLNKKSVYIGEPIIAQLILYSLYEIDIIDYKPGNYNGFWTQDMINQKNIQAVRKIINGKNYLVATMDKKLIFPQKTGELKITPYKLEVQLYDFWGFPSGTKTIYSNQASVIVKPLPEKNKPSDFSGAVGTFSISAKLDKDTANLDQPVKLVLKISGTGNFGLFDDPDVNLPTTFEAIQNTSKDNLSPSIDGLTGSKTYTFLFVPRAPGNYTIQPITFSYFNPQTKKYYTIETKTLNIYIKNAPTDTSSYKNITTTPIQELAKDITYIYDKPFKLHKKNLYCYKRKYFILSYVIILLITAIYIFWRREKIKSAKDVRKQKFLLADKITKKHLKRAYALLKQNKIQEFYQAIDSALSDYVSNKLDIPKSELTLENITQKMLQFDIDTSIAEKYTEIIKKIQTARFAPEIAQLDPKEAFDQAKNIIAEIEKNFKA